MKTNTKTVLGLDLGSTSIGWALILVDLDNNPLEILGMGSRIISLSSKERDEFQQGKAISTNQERTTMRTIRKGYDRRQLRKNDLKNLLKSLGMMADERMMELDMLELWKLRSDANTNMLEPPQLGRILYMLNQKRGYKSLRSEEGVDKKDTDYVQAVKGRYAKLKDLNQTIGTYYYEGLKNARENSQYFRVKEEVYPREAYIEEFDRIMAEQKKHHSFLSDEVIQILKDKIIFFQRPLKSQKGLVSICEFEGLEKEMENNGQTISKFIGPKVAPRSSPLFQLTKIWETINNISIKVLSNGTSKYKWNDYKPSLEQKKQIADYLWENEKLGFKELVKMLGLKESEVYVNKQILKGLQGNQMLPLLKKVVNDPKVLKFNIQAKPIGPKGFVVDKKTGELILEEDRWIIDESFEKEPLYQLWHTIYSIKDIDECRRALTKNFGFDETDASALSKIDFSKMEYANKSSKAIRKTLPYLMKGYGLYEAESLAGYNSRSLTKDERENTGKAEKMELLKKNSLRQPVVEKILNQMINVVNAIIEKYGKPDEIRVELARELKQSKDEREEADKAMRNNEKLNKFVADRLTELGLPATKRFIEKYKFIFPTREKNWKEAQTVNQCIYCGENFSLTEALNGDAFDVDHIVPKTLLFDDSQTNKVLVHRKCNGSKTNLTAYDYIAAKDNALDDYLARVDEWYKKGILSYGKMNRLKVSHKEYLERKRNKKETEADKRLWEGFIDRNLRETQYITRKSRELLGKICNNVTLTEGNVTALLRHLWGWDDVLMNLQFQKFKDLEQTDTKTWQSNHGKSTHSKEVITNWSKRDDYRHHAIDALVVACTKQGFIQRINTLNAADTKDEMQREIDTQKKQDANSAINKTDWEHTNKTTKLEEYLKTQRPQNFSPATVAKEADKILISFKPGKKAATISKYKASGANTTKGVITPRGALHEQSIYGKIKALEKNKALKYLFENPHSIVDYEVKRLIISRLEEFGFDAKKALTSTKKRLLYKQANDSNPIEYADCYRDEVVLKYKIENITAKDVEYIVDGRVKALVKERLDKHNGKEKEAWKTVLWYNEEKQIPIRSVRLFTKLQSVEAVKKDENGREIGFAVPGNNHHIAIYENEAGQLVEHNCTFWQAIDRKRYGIPAIIEETNNIWSEILGKNLPETFLSKLPPDNLKLKLSLQQNEMFILGLSPDVAQQAITEKNYSLLSKHLYLVWSVSPNNYWFRHHLETKVSDLKTTLGAKEAKRYYLFKSIGGLNKEMPIKVRINFLGEIIN